MMSSRIRAFCLLAGLVMTAAGARAETGEEAMAQPMHFLVQLNGTREGWPEDMSEREARIMGEHFVYLQNLMHEGKVLLAGPVMDPVWGLVALEVESEREARDIMDAEPSVAGGVHTYTLHPFSASLLSGRDRFAEDPREKAIVKELVVKAPRDEVWRAWTTSEGVGSFFCSRNRVELRVGGPYEMYFDPSRPEGQQGSEGCRILAYSPGEMLAFSWNAPPQFPEIRRMRTQVVIRLEDAGEERTRVRLVNHGYGEGENWEPVYEYFDQAWGFVLESLRKHFAGEE
jgi:uncharacterized protein YndB with AHSA1/START domain/uncharacterized protein YciI